MHTRHETTGVRFGADGCDSSSSGGSSPASLSGPSGDSDDGSTSTDEYCPDDPREFRRHVSFFSPSVLAEVDPSSFRSISPSFSCVLADVDKHLQRMVLVLPAFPATIASSVARTDALRQWLAGFDVGWVLDMDDRGSLPRREVGRRVRKWAHALGAMERVFRHRHREVRSPVNDAAAAELATLGQLAAESACAMLRLAGSVAALGSSPSKLLAALDVHAPSSETYPGIGTNSATRGRRGRPGAGAHLMPGGRARGEVQHAGIPGAGADLHADLSMFLLPGWVLAREERMEGYLKCYLEVSWSVLQRLRLLYVEHAYGTLWAPPRC